jgi:hypothetical protein
MRIWSRLIAAAILSVPFARWMHASEVSKMDHYRALSPDALLAVLQEQHQATLGFSYAGVFLLLAGCFLFVHGGGIAIERLVAYLSGKSPRS